MDPRTPDPAEPELSEPELSELDDHAFIAERRRVRAQLEHAPEHEVSPALAERVRELDEEFIRRARIAWQQASYPPGPRHDKANPRGEQEGSTPMNDGTVIKDPQELTNVLLTEERAYMVRWLALEVLLTDTAVCDDEDLYDRLSILQEKWQQETLARYR